MEKKLVKCEGGPLDGKSVSVKEGTTSYDAFVTDFTRVRYWLKTRMTTTENGVEYEDVFVLDE